MKQIEFVEGKRYAHLTPGQMLREMREAKGLTQETLAARLGCKQTNVSAWENGRATIGEVTAKRLAAALGVHPAIILFPDWDSEREQWVRRKAS